MRPSGTGRAPTRLHRPDWLLSVAALVLLAGCGGGGGGGGGEAPAALRIATTALPAAGHQMPYSVALQATGGRAPYAWDLVGGSSLPPGLSLATTGVLAGTATTLGTWTFSVSVTDADAEQANSGYSLTVTSFDASVGLLRFGEAWTGESYPVSAVGSASTTFALVRNESGGRLTNANPATSTATWVAGTSPGTDLLRATSSTGLTEDLEIVVQPNPAANMDARFGSTDVWYVRFRGRKDGSHAFTSDWHRALARAGLRGATSTSLYGTAADELADACVRVMTLRYLNQMYGNASDGSPRTGGLAISFPIDEPGEPWVPVGEGLIASPASNQYNVLSVIAGEDSGVIGTAWLDDEDNGAQENNTTTSDAGSLGVFCDELVTYYNVGYSNSTLPAAPVGPNDLAALKAILYGSASPGGRYEEIRRVADGLARTLAAVAAHEIGHSLGLTHTSPSSTGSLMNGSTTIGPDATYAFTASDWSRLLGCLPGAGRTGSGLRVEALMLATGDEGSLGFSTVTCGCRLHH